MSIGTKAVESFAESFHRYHCALAPDFGCSSCLADDWSRLSHNERKLYVAAARLAFLEISADAGSSSGELLCDWSSGGTEGRECGC